MTAATGVCFRNGLVSGRFDPERVERFVSGKNGNALVCDDAQRRRRETA